jgi:hypothetical protein
MTALELMMLAHPYIGLSAGGRSALGQFQKSADLFDALSIAGDSQPNAVISSFHYIRKAVGVDNLLEWHQKATQDEMKEALAKAIELASTPTLPEAAE